MEALGTRLKFERAHGHAPCQMCVATTRDLTGGLEGIPFIRMVELAEGRFVALCAEHWDKALNADRCPGREHTMSAPFCAQCLDLIPSKA